METWKALGASPVSMNSGDLYSGLERGVIDGLEWAWAGIDSYKTYEVVKYYTDLPVTSFPTAFAMNLEKWNSLPKDIQDAMMSVSGRIGARLPGIPGGAWPPDEAQTLLEKWKTGGFSLEKVSLDPGQEEEWKKIGHSVWDKWVADEEAQGRPAQKVLDELLAIRAKYE